MKKTQKPLQLTTPMTKEQNRRLLNTMTGSITHIQKRLQLDSRCKHGMLHGQCSFCAGFAPSQYAQSVGAAWIR